jgi:hypothetical protein
MNVVGRPSVLCDRARQSNIVGMLLSVLFAAHSSGGAAIGLVSLFVAAGLVLTNRSAGTTAAGPHLGRPIHAQGPTG